jgi:hypothetical protein
MARGILRDHQGVAGRSAQIRWVAQSKCHPQFDHRGRNPGDGFGRLDFRGAT